MFQYDFDMKFKENYIKTADDIERFLKKDPKPTYDEMLAETMVMMNDNIKDILKDYHENLMKYLDERSI